MEISGLIVALVGLVLIGVGISVGLIASAALAVLAGVGIVSSSVLTGFGKRRTLAGVQAFFVQCGVLLGAPAGAALAWLAWHAWSTFGEAWGVLAMGAVGGAVGGLVVAWLASAAAAGVLTHAWPWLRGRVTVFLR